MEAATVVFSRFVSSAKEMHSVSIHTTGKVKEHVWSEKVLYGGLMHASCSHKKVRSRYTDEAVLQNAILLTGPESLLFYRKVSFLLYLTWN